MSEPIKVDVVSYGGVKPGQVVAGMSRQGGKNVVFDAATATGGDYEFYKATALQGWDNDLPLLQSAGFMFQGCSGMQHFNGDMPKLTSCMNMFLSCPGLLSFEGALGSLVEANYMFNGCAKLERFVSSDLHSLENGSTMFNSCTSLKVFEADLDGLKNGQTMFATCILDAASVQRILNTIPDRTDAETAPTLHLGHYANYRSSSAVAELLGTNVPIASGTYNFKGWNIIVSM